MKPNRRDLIVDLCATLVYLWFALDQDDKRIIGARVLRGTSRIAAAAAHRLGRIAIHTEAKSQEVIHP